ncbi:MAG: hypothetical protein EBU84_20715 [Actinobacteria bacterium]|nr:hypothetical protein [Actinomycetota bacterium]
MRRRRESNRRANAANTDNDTVGGGRCVPLASQRYCLEMTTDESSRYFIYNDPIKEFAYQLTTEDLDKFTIFLRSLTQEDYNDLFQTAGEIAVEMLKEHGFELYETLTFLGEDERKNAMREVFENFREKTAKEMIIQKFQESS